MRYYFHLYGPDGHAYPDEIGVEASSLEAAKAEALQAIQETRDDCHAADETWRDWHLETTGTSREVLFTIALDLKQHFQHAREQVSATVDGGTCYMASTILPRYTDTMDCRPSAGTTYAIPVAAHNR